LANSISAEGQDGGAKEKGKELWGYNVGETNKLNPTEKRTKKTEEDKERKKGGGERRFFVGGGSKPLGLLKRKVPPKEN